ncbi:hypothetical protein CISG_03436 [Coccidioides immitis RMSCC 3703]|uniref:Uncharacterized protein n=1 Tax=Coccidioides immitis RMSCC 3703 TaxID=454286 RepID=A0A0J8QL92_COCIT|nr:hypothetical protein CISG_03436 [Coccidioides immitis RMSCC 3703]
MSFAVTRAYREEITRILADAAPHLRDPKFCTTPKQNLERLGLKLHSSYIASELCRPALKVTADPTDATTAAVRKECIQALSRTVEAYVELHAANPQASRSWISLQRTISSAFLLAVLEESKHDAHIRCLLLQLEHAIAERTAADATDKGPSPGASKSVSEGSPHLISGVTNIPTSTLDPTQISTTSTIPASVATDTETQWQKPLTKSLRALQKLNAAFSMHSRQQQVQPIGSLPSMSSSPGVGVSISGWTVNKRYKGRIIASSDAGKFWELRLESPQPAGPGGRIYPSSPVAVTELKASSSLPAGTWIPSYYVKYSKHPVHI